MDNKRLDEILAVSSEPEKDHSAEKNRVLISFVPYNIGRFGVPSPSGGNIIPGELTIVPRIVVWKALGRLRSDWKAAKARREPIQHEKTYSYPGPIAAAISRESAMSQFGDIGLRQIPCLMGLDSAAKRQELQDVLLPASLFVDAKGRADRVDLHKRVDDHLFTIIEDYEPSSIEVMAARTILESSQVGAAWKEEVLRTAQTEALTGRSDGLSRVHNQWRLEIGAVLDEKVRLANSLPNELQPSQLSPRAEAPAVVTAEPSSAAMDAALDKYLEKMLTEKGMKLVAVEPETIVAASKAKGK